MQRDLISRGKEVSTLLFDRPIVTTVRNKCNNLLLTECKGCTGEYWPEAVTKTTESQYSPVWLELARLVHL